MKHWLLAVLLMASAEAGAQELTTAAAATAVDSATLQLSEWDGLRHVTAANGVTLRQVLEQQSEGWLPWAPVLFLEPPLVIWTDFSRLPRELAGLSKQWGQDRSGVKFRGLQVRVNLDPPVEELWGQWAFT